MEGLANRVAPSHMLQAQQNIAGSTHYGTISLQQTQPENMPPPSYEESQLAVQAVDMQQITNMEAEKQAIYRHPLLPLLAKLFEKCEQSTQTCDCTPANAFDNEIKNGIIQMNREGKPFYTDDRDLDNLVRRIFFGSSSSSLNNHNLFLDVGRQIQNMLNPRKLSGHSWQTLSKVDIDILMD